MNPKVDSSRYEVEKRTREKANNFARLFATPRGKIVMEALENEFDSSTIFDPDPNITNYNLGRRDVVIYIKQMIKFSEQDND